MANLSNINNKFLVTTGGNVGINTTSPGQKLVVTGNIGTSGSVLFDDNQGINFGNSNAKIYGSSSDGIKFNAGGSEGMRFNQSGNLGIGTVSPGTKLDVRGSGYFLGTASSGAALVTIENNSGSTATSYGLLVIGGGNSSNGRTFEVRDASGNTDLIVKGDGNVGIGTDSPGEKLEVAGNVGVNGFITHNGDSGTFMGWSANDTNVFYTAGNERLRIDASGNVGIGEDNPQELLHLTATTPVFRLEGGSHSYQQYVSGTSFYIRDVTNSSNRIVLDSSGNFGIGTTSPNEKLVIGTTGGTQNIEISNSYIQSFNRSGSPGYQTLNFYASSYAFNVGNVGIGTTSPASKFEVYGGNSGVNDVDRYIRFKASNGEKRFDFYVGGTGNASSLGMYTSDGTTKNVQISGGGTSYFNSGNVGIGTTSPGEKLEVNGVIQIKRIGDHPAIRFVENTTTRGYIGTGDWAVNGGADADLGISSAGTGSLILGTNSGNGRVYIVNGGNVGIGTTNPSSELEVDGRAIVEKLEVARYSDSNAPAAVYVGRSANVIGQGGIFRLGAIESSSTVNKIDEPFLITYSSGHWGSQPMFFAEFTITYYRGSYIKYWAQHEVSGSRLEIVDGPYGGQIISGGAPVSRTITQLCTNCHGGQPVYKCVWKWSNSGTYIKTSPIVSLADGPGTGRVYTSGSSSESAIDTLYGSASSPGVGYLLMGINNAQAAGFTGLQTQN